VVLIFALSGAGALYNVLTIALPLMLPLALPLTALIAVMIVGRPR
jgi:hypothetical protein